MRAESDSFREFVVERLERLPDFRCRGMFGGFGLYSGDQFFGLIFDRSLYFRTDEETRLEYVAAGMDFFRPNPKQSLKSYYEVPADVIEDGDVLLQWAEKAVRSSK